MDFNEQRYRYERDPYFRKVVDHIYHFLCEGQFSMGEMRDATTFAANMFEARHARTLLIEMDGTQRRVKEPR
jgi:hypothetical protein